MNVDPSPSPLLSSANRPEVVNILGVQVHPVDVATLHAIIAAEIAADHHSLVLNVNVHCLNLAYKHAWLRDFLNEAEFVFCDGAGVILGARILGKHIPQRITYADWTWQLAAFAADHGYSLYFLGGRPGVADKAAQTLQARFPALRVVGTQHGFFDKTAGGEENASVVAAINAAAPNILMVGFGMPLQERWLRDNWQQLNVNIGLTGGAVFDYVSGELQRAPRWMTDNGMEWLGRLLIEPRRLWQRYVVGNPIFMLRVLRQRLQER